VSRAGAVVDRVGRSTGTPAGGRCRRAVGIGCFDRDRSRPVQSRGALRWHEAAQLGD